MGAIRQYFVLFPFRTEKLHLGMLNTDAVVKHGEDLYCILNSRAKDVCVTHMFHNNIRHLSFLCMVVLFASAWDSTRPCRLVASF